MWVTVGGAHAGVLLHDGVVEGVGHQDPCQVGNKELASQWVDLPELVGCRGRSGQQSCKRCTPLRNLQLRSKVARLRSIGYGIPRFSTIAVLSFFCLKNMMGHSRLSTSWTAYRMRAPD